MIIGITGQKRHGKDSLALALALTHDFRRTAFADPLKRALMEIYDLDYEQCYGTTEEKERIDPRYGKSAREMMQQFGTEVGRKVYQSTWVEAVFRVDIARWEESGMYPSYNREMRQWVWKAKRDDFGYFLSHRNTRWAITDCRFKDEAGAIRQRGGHIFRVTRPMEATGDTHASEVEQREIQADCEILNDGTLEQLGERTSVAFSTLLGSQ